MLLDSKLLELTVELIYGLIKTPSLLVGVHFNCMYENVIECVWTFNIDFVTLLDQINLFLIVLDILNRICECYYLECNKKCISDSAWAISGFSCDSKVPSLRTAYRKKENQHKILWTITIYKCMHYWEIACIILIIMNHESTWITTNLSVWVSC